MKLLKEISDETLGLGKSEQTGEKYELRKSARAILLNDKGEMATQYLNTYKYHKLPGGGVEVDETIKQALKREVLEEVGCECETVSTVGMTLEYRNEWMWLHVSYCFVANVDSDIGETKLEPGEIEEGHETFWLPPETVLEKMEIDSPQHYEGHFVLEREKTFLMEYLANKHA